MNTTTKSIGLGAGGLIVGVLIALGLGNITANNYPGPFLEHLVDIVRGNNTTTAVATNVPAWGFGLSMPTPVATTIATSSHPNAASGLASSTPYTFAVAALDGTGTTTISNTLSITTDASTTQPRPEDVVLSWAAVQGATGYAIFFSTSTNATTFSQYFYATTTGQFVFSTSTGALAGSDTLTVGTAFSEFLNPVGPEIFNDSISSATSTPAASTTVAQFNGTVDAVANGTTTACEADTAGVIFFNLANSHEWGCNGTAWTKIF